jgi:hypothetical protein
MTMQLIAQEISVARLIQALTGAGLDTRFVNGALIVREQGQPAPRIPDDNITDLRPFLRRRAGRPAPRGAA